MAKTKRKQELDIASWSEADRLAAKLGLVRRKREHLEAARDAEIESVRNAYGWRIEKQASTEARVERELEAFVRAHRSDLGPDGRGVFETAHGKFGIRLGPPKVKPRPRQTLNGAVEAISELAGGVLTACIRTKTSLDKRTLLQLHAEGEIGDEELADVGLRVVQDEHVSVEPREEPEPVTE